MAQSAREREITLDLFSYDSLGQNMTFQRLRKFRQRLLEQDSRWPLMFFMVIACGLGPQSARAQQLPRVVVLPLEESSEPSSESADSESRRERARKMQAFQKAIKFTGFHAEPLSADAIQRALDAKERSSSHSSREPFICGRECQEKVAKRHKSDLVGGSVAWQGRKPIKLSLWWWRVDPTSGAVLFKPGGSELQYRAEQRYQPTLDDDKDDKLWNDLIGQVTANLAGRVRGGEVPALVAVAPAQPPELTQSAGPTSSGSTFSPNPAPNSEVAFGPIPPPHSGKPTTTQPLNPGAGNGGISPGGGAGTSGLAVLPPAQPERTWGRHNFSRPRQNAVLAVTPIVVLGFLAPSIALASLDGSNTAVGTAPFMGPPSQHDILTNETVYLPIRYARPMYGIGFAITVAWGAAIGLLVTAPSSFSTKAQGSDQHATSP